MNFSGNKTAETKMFSDIWSWDDLYLDLGMVGDRRRGLYQYVSQIWTQAKDLTENVKNYLSPEPKCKGEKKFFVWFSIIYMFHAILNEKNEKKNFDRKMSKIF